MCFSDLGDTVSLRSEVSSGSNREAKRDWYKQMFKSMNPDNNRGW